MSRIYCTTLDEFYNAIEELVSRGIGFNAHADQLVITLTGGF